MAHHSNGLRDESLESTANRFEPDVLANKMMEDLEAALEQFRGVAEDVQAAEAAEAV